MLLVRTLAHISEFYPMLQQSCTSCGSWPTSQVQSVSRTAQGDALSPLLFLCTVLIGSECNAVTLKTSWHNQLWDHLVAMFKAAGWEDRDSESANWLTRNLRLRPFDVVVHAGSYAKRQVVDVTCSDLTRPGIIPTGTTYC